MYTSFYNLKTKPFQLNADPRFLWLGEMHKEALATLKYGVLSNEGFLLLTGDVGTGKTTLINTLIESLADDVICASVSDPSLSKLDFFNYIAFLFGIEKEFSTKGTFLAHFEKFLLDANKKKKRALLIIDESQLLTPEMFEEIRLLSNIEKTDTKLINIFFVGQNELIESLRKEGNRAVRQRLKLNYNIGPLTPNEIDQYIKHRLKIAGANYTIFKPDAVQEITIHSGGYPRRINVICDWALLAGYTAEKKTIDGAMVKECAEELDLKTNDRNRKAIDVAPLEPAIDTSPEPELPETIEPGNTKNITRVILLSAITFVLVFAFCWWIVLPLSYRFERKQDYPDGGETSTALGGTQVYTAMQNSKVFKVQDHLEAVGETSDPFQAEIQLQGMQTTSITSRKEVTSQDPNPSVEAPEILPLPEDPLIVRFDLDSNMLSDEGYLALTEFADAIVMHPDTRLLIAGYTDADGSPGYNQKLSEYRANMIKTFLIGKGISPDHMETKGFGRLNPLESNETPWGRMMNRRVEINILK